MKKLNQQGAAAILSVVIFAIIITIVVTAYIRSAITGQAEAFNFDQRTRAYYAAESGIQDALRYINNTPGYTSKDSCSSFVPSGDGKLDTSGNLAYTCQLIDTTPSSINFSVGQDDNGTARLLPADMSAFPPSDAYNLIISWSLTSESQSLNYIPRSDGSELFPSQSVWSNDQFYPALRTSVLSLPITGTLNSSNTKQDVFFLNPTDNSAVGNMNVNSTTGVTPQARVQSAHCYENDSSESYDGYKCQKIITLSGYPLDTIALYVRLHSLYSKTDVQLALAKKDSTEPVALKGGVIQIDVTGKSGDTFRRVRQTYNLQNGVMLDNLPEAAAIGGDGICKYYSITDKADDFQPSGNCFN